MKIQKEFVEAVTKRLQERCGDTYAAITGMFMGCYTCGSDNDLVPTVIEETIKEVLAHTFFNHVEDLLEP